MSVSFEDAIARSDPRFAAWDITTRGDEALVSIFAIDRAGGAIQLASRRVRASERSNIDKALVEAGLAIGAYDLRCDFVWVDQPTGFTVFDNRARRVLADETHVHLLFDEVVRRSDLTQVETWASDDMVERGIIGVTYDGRRVPLLLDHVPAVAADPDYDRTDLRFETRWCEVVGRRLAAWADVPFHHRIGEG
ncbi:MAG TPA: hypothetical protein PK095_08545 [Myxococcota bacterium]|nr:hypothetical protein [Myxococcota bacterium]